MTQSLRAKEDTSYDPADDRPYPEPKRPPGRNDEPDSAADTDGSDDTDEKPARPRLPRPLARRMLLGVLLLALSGLGVLVLAATAVAELTESPKDPVVTWLEAIRDRDKKAALEVVCDKEDSQGREFTELFFRDPPDKGKRFSFFVREPRTYGGNLARVPADILADGEAERWSFTVVEENGDWKMCSIKR